MNDHITYYDKKVEVDVIILDFSRHPMPCHMPRALLQKLSCYGIRGNKTSMPGSLHSLRDAGHSVSG